MKWQRMLLWLCVIAVAVGIFCFSAQNGPASSAASDAVAEVIIQVIDPDFDQLSTQAQGSVFSFVKKLVRKGAHFTEFAVLGFFVRLLINSYGLRWGSRLAWLAGTLYACTDELHQLFVASRAAMWQDVLLDSCGVAAGVMLAHAVLVLISRVRQKKAGNAG
ncbi:MAG: VanZ family protein [Clostridia bacterium]|nr:VanZ family protein [Clostridia bacterium]